MELPLNHHYLGIPCPRCSKVGGASKNTVIEEYSKTLEATCLSCNRPLKLPRKLVTALQKKFKKKIV